MASPAARDGEEKPPLDIDAILNRHRVNLARSQKIIERWHPKSQEEIARDNDGKDVVVNFDDLLRPELYVQGLRGSLHDELWLN